MSSHDGDIVTTRTPAVRCRNFPASAREVRLLQQHAHAARGDQLLQVRQVPRRGRNARHGLDRLRDFDPERVREIRPRAVIREDGFRLHRRDRRAAVLERGLGVTAEGFRARPVLRRVHGIGGRERFGDRVCHDRAVARVEPVVRVALGMHVAHGRVHAPRGLLGAPHARASSPRSRGDGCANRRRSSPTTGRVRGRRAGRAAPSPRAPWRSAALRRGAGPRSRARSRRLHLFAADAGRDRGEVGGRGGHAQARVRGDR